MSERKHVDARDIGAKQSFVASPGHDERDAYGTVTIVRRGPRLRTSSCPGFAPAIHVLRLQERSKGRGCPGRRREASVVASPGHDDCGQVDIEPELYPPSHTRAGNAGNGAISSDQMMVARAGVAL